MVAQNLAVAVLSSGVTRKTARTIAREIAREAYQVDGALLIFGRPSQVRQDARFRSRRQMHDAVLRLL